MRVILLLAVCLSAQLLPAIAVARLPPPPDNTVWTGIETVDGLELHGRGWPLAAMPANASFTRLPASAKGCCAMDNGEVWDLAQSPSGLKVRFATNATRIYVRWTLAPLMHSGLISDLLGDWLWPTNGHSGTDIYIDNGPDTPPRWAISSGNNPTMHTALLAGNTTLFTGLSGLAPGVVRNLTVYLPLWNRVTAVAIGIVPTEGTAPAQLQPPAASRGRVVWYGTSIMHGAAAARPGMGWPNQAERLLGMDGVNLGFSGHGWMQPEIPPLLAQIEGAAIYVLDCEFNMDRFPETTVYNLTLAFVRALRSAAPRVPVLLIEGHNHTRAWIDAGVAASQNATREAYRHAYNQLLDEGLPHVFYLRGEDKFGTVALEAQQAAVAGVHPEPLGLRLMAVYVSDRVRAVLNGTAVPAPVPTGPWPVAGTRGGAGGAEKGGGAGVSITSADTAVDETQGKLKQHEASRRPASAAAAAAAAANGLTVGVLTSGPAPPAPPPVEAADLALEGLGFAGQPANCRYCRLPYVNRTDVPAGIWLLATYPSGVLARFNTNATELTVDITYTEAGVRPDDIQTGNGQRGLDLFAAGDGAVPGGWRWAATSAGSTFSTAINASWQITGLPAEPRDYTLYLPIYAPVSSVRVGVPAGAVLRAAPRYAPDTRPVVVWGSSIAQGGVVANAGATWPAQLQRLLDRPLVNLGFSGSCHFQLPVAALVAAVQPVPSVVLVDCLPNTCGDDSASTAACANSTATAAYAALLLLRNALPASTALVVLEGHTYTNNWLLPAQAAMQAAKRAGQRTAFDTLQRQGLPNLHYVSGDGKLGPDPAVASESSAGIGVHPTGLAHLHTAQYLRDVVQPLL